MMKGAKEVMNQPISFRTAGTVLFGDNSLDQIADVIKEVGADRILVITDKGIIQCGLVDRLKACLRHFNFSFYDDTEETPSLETIRKCTQFAKEGGYDLLIGFGGGSPMDATKAVTIMMTNEGDIEEYLGRDTVRVPGVKKILVPTTAGTGSEVTVFSVLAWREKNVQAITGIIDRHMLPEWAIIDPTLTLGMPSSLTANTGIDAFSHAVESYLNIKSNFQTEPLSLASIKLISQNIEKATAHGADSQVRYNMSAGSVLAGMSLSQTGGGLAHAVAETFQIPYKIAHGAAIAAILPHVMSYNLVERPDKYADVAKAMGLSPDGFSETDLAKKAVKRVQEIIDRLGLPKSLSELNIPEKDLETIARSTLELSPSLLKVNPRSASEQDLLNLLRDAY